ncbi:vesicle-associated protein 2-2-like isoform X2 [Euphorbia lathyris]|uniref:vesicle-associated protein 2-2-like isoform X2 n=1 Tax=Euphorbia lathyris TaxID=212925 RepID=UPI0033144B38
MTTELLEIQPCELRFTFELKKQSSCSIQLSNMSDHYVAFKVKTTSPKKYCVRPNIGIVKPKSTSVFTVTMQAQKAAPQDLHCKDKFLIQSTVVPIGTTEEDIIIASSVFSKESGKYIEEKKLRVVLASPSHSPVLLPNNGEFKKEQCYETLSHQDIAQSGIENIPPPQRLAEEVSDFQHAKNFEELKLVKNAEPWPCNDARELELAKDVEEPKLVKDFEELKSKLHNMDSKLKQADHTIARLSDERSTALKEKDILKQELEFLKRENMKRTQVGFPLLYVCTVALISLAFGYLIRRS